MMDGRGREDESLRSGEGGREGGRREGQWSGGRYIGKSREWTVQEREEERNWEENEYRRVR